MAVEFNFSGKWEDYCELLRRFSLDSILKYVNSVSTELCFGDGMKHSHTMVSIPITAKGSGVWEKMPVLVTTWNLVNLSYYAILATHDYRGKKLENEEDFFAICAVNLNYMQTIERNTVNSIAKSPELLFYVWGFAGEQFNMQNPSYVFENAARELYILFEISKRIREIDIPEIIRKETGAEWFEITASILIAWFCFARSLEIEHMEKIVKWDEQFSLLHFRKVIESYTTNYNEVKESPLGRQVFYTKPYVKTQRGELLSINCYLNLCLYEHCILWIVRDYYMKLDSHQFIILFGNLFEEYFSELLFYCLESGQFMKIPRVKDKKRADWRMEILGYRFLIEQKSSLLRLAAKQQESDYKATVDFAARTVIKALKQLEATELDYADGKYIKIILLYEDYLTPSIMDYVFSLSECTVQNDNRYWLMTIDDMERFLYEYKTNPTVAEEIINERMNDSKDSSIKSISYLLNKHGIQDNRYLQQSKIENYKTYTLEFIRRHLINRGK